MNVPALLATYQLRQREYLLRITHAMTSRLDLPSLLRLILNSAVEMVGCRAGLIVLERDDVEAQNSSIALSRFQIRAVHNIDPQFLPAFEPLLDVGPYVQLGDYDDPDNPDVSSASEPRVVDLQERVRQVEERIGGPLGQVVGIPLLFEQDLLGLIYLFRGEYAFTQMDTQLLQGFANQAAVAVRNAKLYLQLENERSQLATIIENSADGILILNAQQQALVINQALATMLDLDPLEAVGLEYHEVLSLDLSLIHI